MMTLRDHPHSKVCALAMLCFAILVTLSTPLAAQHEVSLTELVADTQKQTDSPNRLALVWWLPEEFWEVSNAASGTDPAVVEEILAIMRPYVVMAVVDGKIGPLGGATFYDEATIRETVRLIDSEGRKYEAIPAEDVPPDLQNLFASLRPIMSNLIGPMGENLAYLAFPAKTPEDRMIAAATEPGEFAVQIADELMEWRLPLGSLLPPKVCPQDGEELNGAWSYCPWHGKPLEAKPAAEPKATASDAPKRNSDS